MRIRYVWIIFSGVLLYHGKEKTHGEIDVLTPECESLLLIRLPVASLYKQRLLVIKIERRDRKKKEISLNGDHRAETGQS